MLRAVFSELELKRFKANFKASNARSISSFIRAATTSRREIRIGCSETDRELINAIVHFSNEIRKMPRSDTVQRLEDKIVDTLDRIVPRRIIPK